jgi:BlaI family penicillinase repressor
MADVPRISDAEWEVMRVLWEEGPLAASEVFDRLAPHHDWSERTVKTMISRLVKKGALSFEDEGKRYRYRARVAREECVREASRSFLERVFGGAVRPALLTFVRESDLSPREVEELTRLLGEEDAR